MRLLPALLALLGVTGCATEPPPVPAADPPAETVALDGQMTAEGETYDLVRVTFDAGTGDAPDDYYVLLLDPATDRVGGVQAASGITLQDGFRSFAWTDDGVGEPTAHGVVSDVRFVPDALFAMPADAAVQEEM